MTTEIKQLSMDFTLPAPAPIPESKVVAEHWRAERQRLDEGEQGCGCQLCQELYRTLDLSAYGGRVLISNGLVQIKDKPKAKPPDSWDDMGRFHHYGKIYSMQTLSVDGSRREVRFVVVPDKGAPVMQPDAIIIRGVTVAVDCPSYDACDAPLCPKDSCSLKSGIWYPGESVCGCRGEKPRWVKVQQKINRRGKGRAGCFFTVPDLEKIKAVRNPAGHRQK